MTWGSGWELESGREIVSYVKNIDRECILGYGGPGRHAHGDVEVAGAQGFSDLLGWGMMMIDLVSEELCSRFMYSWMRNSYLDVRLIAPVLAGDLLRISGTVKSATRVGAGTRVEIAVLAETQRTGTVGIGSASVNVSPEGIGVLEVST